MQHGKKAFWPTMLMLAIKCQSISIYQRSAHSLLCLGDSSARWDTSAVLREYLCPQISQFQCAPVNIQPERSTLSQVANFKAAASSTARKVNLNCASFKPFKIFIFLICDSNKYVESIVCGINRKNTYANYTSNKRIYTFNLNVSSRFYSHFTGSHSHSVTFILSSTPTYTHSLSHPIGHSIPYSLQHRSGEWGHSALQSYSIVQWDHGCLCGINQSALHPHLW